MNLRRIRTLIMMALATLLLLGLPTIALAQDSDPPSDPWEAIQQQGVQPVPQAAPLAAPPPAAPVPSGIAMYVAGNGSDMVHVYDATSGANTANLTQAGMDRPWFSVLGPDGLLYVSSRNTNEVYRFNPVSDTFVDIFVTAGLGGLANPSGLAFGPNSNLFVASNVNNLVIEYNGTTGALVGTFADATGVGGISGIGDLVVGPDNNFYATDFDSDIILQINSGTGVVTNFGNTGDGPWGLTFGPNGNIFVANFSGTVTEINGITGALVGTFINSNLSGPLDIAFHPVTGDAYVTDGNNREVDIFNGATGVFSSNIVASGSGGLSFPSGIIFIANRELRIT